MITDFKWLDWEKQKFKETQVKRRAILSIRGVSQNSVASSTTGRTNPARPSGSTYLHNWVPHPCFSLTSISSFHRSSWWFCSPQSLPSTVFHHVIWFTLLLLSKEKQKRREGGEKEKREEKKEYLDDLSSVQSLSCVWLFVIPWTAACQASLSISKSRNLLKLMSVESVMPSNHLIFCHPLLLLPSIFPSIRVFSNESALHIRWPKDWSFSFSISPSNEDSGLISSRMD